jgi:hypothetical protein
MTSKKKKSVKKSPILEKPFVGPIPVYKDGTAITQPIIQEESKLIQDVNVLTLPQCEIQGINSGLIAIAAETGDPLSTTIYTTTLTQNCMLLFANIISVVRAGTLIHGTIELRAGTPKILAYQHLTGYGGSFNIAFPYAIKLKAGDTIDLVYRRGVNACQTEHHLHLAILYI